jgi:hypothetical protein
MTSLEQEEYLKTYQGQIDAWTLGLAHEAGGEDKINWRNVAEEVFLAMEEAQACANYYQKAILDARERFDFANQKIATVQRTAINKKREDYIPFYGD